MKVIVSESLGLEYAMGVISSCDQNGMQAIADNQNNEILFYDPKNRQYCTNKDLMNADYSIHDVFTDKSVRSQVMKPTSGQGFEEFATKWDALQKSDDQDVIKTKNCSMIRFGAHESGKAGVYEAFADSDDWSATEDEVEVQWLIDDKELGIESGSTETVVIDLGLVDCFEDLVYQVELALEKAHGGMMFDYDDEWILVDEDNLLKRFGYNMNESESSGRTIDVTLSFTHGHYGKKLKSGDERTIKLDLDSAPKLYDEDDLLSWIADVASEQIPGGGSFTKYDFETVDPPDDVLIKAVMGDEGFGPDVDVDFEDPDSIPSDIPYGDALKIYQKMREAYDNHKLNYNKYGIIQKKVVEGVVNGLLKNNSLDELADEWFIDYGTANGWGWKTAFKYSIAYKLHEIHRKKYPDQHKPLPEKNNWSGWHEDYCSCGFGSSSDSSD